MSSKSTPGTNVEKLPQVSAAEAEALLWPRLGDEYFPPTLARRAVETYIEEGRILKTKRGFSSPLLQAPAACFVCLKTVERRLRGCIGTVKPVEKMLAEEIIANAVSAATRDPRFRPVTADELPLLRFTVDVLERPVPARFDELDPAEFGVIVEDNTGQRRGLLLPAIDGVETASEQVQIAARKAGLSLDEPHQLYRFRVRRFREAV